MSNHLYRRLLCSFVVLTPAADEQIRLVFFFFASLSDKPVTNCVQHPISVRTKQTEEEIEKKKGVRERRGARDEAMELLSSPGIFLMQPPPRKAEADQTGQAD